VAVALERADVMASGSVAATCPDMRTAVRNEAHRTHETRVFDTEHTSQMTARGLFGLYATRNERPVSRPVASIYMSSSSAGANGAALDAYAAMLEPECDPESDAAAD